MKGLSFVMSYRDTTLRSTESQELKVTGGKYEIRNHLIKMLQYFNISFLLVSLL